MRMIVAMALLLCVSGFARAQDTSLYYNSSPGDYIGQGQQQYYTPQQLTFAVTGNSSNGVYFSATNFNANPAVWWYLNFAAANNATLVPGTYTNAVRFPFQTSSQNGLDFSGSGRGCNTLTGNFTVLEAVYASDGTVTSFAAEFEQHCEGGQAALFGGIRYNSSVTNPVAILNTLVPATVPSGSSANITVNGTNFLASSIVQWNGNNRRAYFVNSTQLTAVIPATDLSGPGTGQITVFTPGQGGGVSNSLPVTITNPVPGLSSVSPLSAAAGGPAFTLTVSGTSFIAGSVVQWNGSSRSTTFVSSTQLTAAISAGDIAAVGTAQITVFNPAPGGGTSAPVAFTMANPVPVISSLAPSSATSGSQAFSLTVNGSNFVAGSVVQWNRVGRPTTFVSSTQLVASIAAADIAFAGNRLVTVFNPAPGGGTSNPVYFSVLNPVPVISSVVPAAAPAGGPSFGLTVNGSNFLPNSVVRWNGSNRATLLISSTQLVAAIAAGDIAYAGIPQITVFNPAPGGGVSNALGFTINPASTTSYTYYFAQMTFGGGWQTTLTYINYSLQSVVCQTNFFADSGAPLPVPFGGAGASTRTDVISSGGTLHQQSTGDPGSAITTGWAQAQCSGPIKASILFRSYQGATAVGEAGVAAMTVPATKFVTFASSQTVVAYANPSIQAAILTINALDSSGAKVGSTSLTLLPGMHGAGTIGQLMGLQTFTGSIQILSSVPILSLSLNFEAAPVFSSLPPGDLDSSTPLSGGP